MNHLLKIQHDHLAAAIDTIRVCRELGQNEATMGVKVLGLIKRNYLFAPREFESFFDLLLHSPEKIASFPEIITAPKKINHEFSIEAATPAPRDSGDPRDYRDSSDSGEED